MARTGELTAVGVQQRYGSDRCCPPNRKHAPLAWGVGLAAVLHVMLLMASSMVHVPPAATSPNDAAVRLTLVHPTPRSSNTPETIDASSPPPAAEDATSHVENGAPASHPHAQAPAYVDVNLLTNRPRMVGDIFITYPPSAPSGTFKTRLTIDIDESGHVERVLIPDNSLPEVLAEAAIAAFKEARFDPGRLHGAPVKTSVQIEVAFDSDDQLVPPD